MLVFDFAKDNVLNVLFQNAFSSRILIRIKMIVQLWCYSMKMIKKTCITHFSTIAFYQKYLKRKKYKVKIQICELLKMLIYEKY